MKNMIKSKSRSGKSTGYISQSMADARKRRAKKAKWRQLLHSATQRGVTHELGEDGNYLLTTGIGNQYLLKTDQAFSGGYIVLIDLATGEVITQRQAALFERLSAERLDTAPKFVAPKISDEAEPNYKKATRDKSVNGITKALDQAKVNYEYTNVQNVVLLKAEGQSDLLLSLVKDKSTHELKVKEVQGRWYRMKRADVLYLYGNKVSKKAKPYVFKLPKHAGKTVEEVLAVDPGYLNWILASDFPLELHDLIRAARLKQKDQAKAE